MRAVANQRGHCDWAEGQLAPLDTQRVLCQFVADVLARWRAIELNSSALVQLLGTSGAVKLRHVNRRRVVSFLGQRSWDSNMLGLLKKHFCRGQGEKAHRIH